MDSRFKTAMGAYVVLAILATYFLTGKTRVALWIFLGGLAAKTLIVTMQRKNED